MSWAQIKKINSDMNTPLDATLGNRSHAAGTAATSSLFGWIKAIHAHLSANLSATRMAQIDTIETRTSAIANSNAVARGAIRSVQRGHTTGVTTGSHMRDIHIAWVDPAKCVVVLHGIWSTSTNAQSIIINLPRVVTFTSTVLTLTGSPGNAAPTGSNFSWEVIEYW